MPDNPYADLRLLALSLTADQIGVTPTAEHPRVFGAVMEIGLEEGSATLVALHDGTVSMYLSSGGGIIGGGGQEAVWAAALEFLRTLSYPGNVRQLKNLLEAAHVLAEEAITRADLERILENGPGLGTPAAPSSDLGTDEPFHAETFEDFKERSEAEAFLAKTPAMSQRLQPYNLSLTPPPASR